MKKFIILLLALALVSSQASALTVNLLSGAKQLGQVDLNPDEFATIQADIVHDPTDLTWSNVHFKAKIVASSDLRPISKIYLFPCKDFDTLNCVTKINPLQADKFTDTEIAWNDLVSDSQKQVPVKYPQTANMIIFLKTEHEQFGPSWQGYLYQISRESSNKFNIKNNNIGKIDYMLKDESLADTVKEYIRKNNMIPYSWASEIVFKDSGKLLALGASHEEMDSLPPAFNPSFPSSSSIKEVGSDLLFIFPEPSDSPRNAITIANNPTFTCGNGERQTSLGESQQNCCADFGCGQGSFCQVPDINNPSSGVCKSIDLISLKISNLQAPSQAACENQVQATFTATIDNMPAGFTPEFQQVSNLNVDLQESSPGVFSGTILIDPPQACGSKSQDFGPYQIQIAGTIEEPSGQRQVSLSATIPKFSVTFSCQCNGQCGDGTVSSGETESNCCQDTGCSSPGAFCSLSGSCTGPGGGSGPVGIEFVNVKPLNFTDCLIDHTATVEVGLKNVPSQATLDDYKFVSDDGLDVFFDSCQLLKGRLIRCSLSIPPIDQELCTLPQVLINGNAQFSLSFADAQSNLRQQQFSATLPAVKLIPTFHIGDGVCETAYGESAATSCVDCPCSKDSKFGSGYYCNVDSQNQQDPGVCSAFSAVDLVIDSPKSQLSFDSCEVDNEIMVHGHIVNQPKGLAIDDAQIKFDGKVADFAKCEFDSESSFYKPFKEDNTKEPVANAITCSIVLPTDDRCGQQASISYADNSLTLFASFPNGLGTELRTMDAKIPSITVSSPGAGGSGDGSGDGSGNGTGDGGTGTGTGSSLRENFERSRKALEDRIKELDEINLKLVDEVNSCKTQSTTVDIVSTVAKLAYCAASADWANCLQHFVLKYVPQLAQVDTSKFEAAWGDITEELAPNPDPEQPKVESKVGQSCLAASEDFPCPGKYQQTDSGLRCIPIDPHCKIGEVVQSAATAAADAAAQGTGQSTGLLKVSPDTTDLVLSGIDALGDLIKQQLAGDCEAKVQKLEALREISVQHIDLQAQEFCAFNYQLVTDQGTCTNTEMGCFLDEETCHERIAATIEERNAKIDDILSHVTQPGGGTGGVPAGFSITTSCNGDSISSCCGYSPASSTSAGAPFEQSKLVITGNAQQKVCNGDSLPFAVVDGIPISADAHYTTSMDYMQHVSSEAQKQGRDIPVDGPHTVQFYCPQSQDPLGELTFCYCRGNPTQACGFGSCDDAIAACEQAGVPFEEQVIRIDGNILGANLKATVNCNNNQVTVDLNQLKDKKQDAGNGQMRIPVKVPFIKLDADMLCTTIQEVSLTKDASKTDIDLASIQQGDVLTLACGQAPQQVVSTTGRVVKIIEQSGGSKTYSISFIGQTPQAKTCQVNAISKGTQTTPGQPPGTPDSGLSITTAPNEDSIHMYTEVAFSISDPNKIIGTNPVAWSYDGGQATQGTQTSTTKFTTPGQHTVKATITVDKGKDTEKVNTVQKTIQVQNTAEPFVVSTDPEHLIKNEKIGVAKDLAQVGLTFDRVMDENSVKTALEIKDKNDADTTFGVARDGKTVNIKFDNAFTLGESYSIRILPNIAKDMNGNLITQEIKYTLDIEEPRTDLLIDPKSIVVDLSPEFKNSQTEWLEKVKFNVFNDGNIIARGNGNINVEVIGERDDGSIKTYGTKTDIIRTLSPGVQALSPQRSVTFTRTLYNSPTGGIFFIKSNERFYKITLRVEVLPLDTNDKNNEVIVQFDNGQLKLKVGNGPFQNMDCADQTTCKLPK